jgi:hypothetical protein
MLLLQKTGDLGAENDFRRAPRLFHRASPTKQRAAEAYTRRPMLALVCAS